MDLDLDVQRVLLVDDEPSIFAVVRRTVERAHPGAVVVYAADVATAAWQLRSTTVRLVLTDMCLGGDAEAGLKVIALAREHQIPVAVMTGSDSDAVDHAIAASIDVLRKHKMTSADISRLVLQAFAE